METLEGLHELEDVPEQYSFRLYRSGTIRNLYELYDALQNMDPEVFYHHVTSEKNDFSNWVRVIHKDYHLADMLRPAMSLHDCASAVSQRIYDIRRTDERSKSLTGDNIDNLLLEEENSVQEYSMITVESADGSDEEKEKTDTDRDSESKDIKGVSSVESYILDIPPENRFVEKKPKKIEDKLPAVLKEGSDTNTADDANMEPAEVRPSDLNEDEDGRLILPPGGDDLLEVAEDSKEGIRKKLKKAKEFIDPKGFADDMKKVFTIETKSKKRRRKIDELKKVCKNEE